MQENDVLYIHNVYDDNILTRSSWLDWQPEGKRKAKRFVYLDSLRCSSRSLGALPFWEKAPRWCRRWSCSERWLLRSLWLAPEEEDEPAAASPCTASSAPRQRWRRREKWSLCTVTSFDFLWASRLLIWFNSSSQSSIEIEILKPARTSTYDMGKIPMRPRCSPSYQLLSTCRMMLTASPFLKDSSLQHVQLVKVPHAQPTQRMTRSANNNNNNRSLFML